MLLIHNRNYQRIRNSRILNLVCMEKKINEKDEDSFVVQEPATGMSVTQTQMSVRRHSASRDVLEESMPCFFSEEELDEEVRMSMKSGNATQSEIDAVFP